jgi:predicted hydrocarbon binding protein
MEQSTQQSAPMMQLMFMGMGALGKAFYEKDGKEALPIITEVSRKGGEEYGKMMQQMAPSGDMKGMAEVFKMMGQMMDMGAEAVEVSDDTFHFKVKKCPLHIEGTDIDLCEAMMNSDRQMISTALGKEVEMKIPQSIAAGDEVCEIIFSVKS